MAITPLARWLAKNKEVAYTVKVSFAAVKVIMWKCYSDCTTPFQNVVAGRHDGTSRPIRVVANVHIATSIHRSSFSDAQLQTPEGYIILLMERRTS